MRATFSNGEVREIDAAASVIIPTVPAEAFDIDDPYTWESDRAWVFLRPGKVLWLGRDVGLLTVVSVG